MSTTDIRRKIKRTPEERIANKQRIAQAKARALRWAQRRTLVREQVTPTETVVPQALRTDELVEQVNPQSLEELTPERAILQDLLSRRTALQQELSELDLTISVLRRTYSI
jgi:hypothetical protein